MVKGRVGQDLAELSVYLRRNLTKKNADMRCNGNWASRVFNLKWIGEADGVSLAS